MVGAGLSDAGAPCVVIVVGLAVVVVVVLAAVVVVVVVVGTVVVVMGSAIVASMFSRTISAPPSSDWLSVMWWTVYILAEWSGRAEGSVGSGQEEEDKEIKESTKLVFTENIADG